MKIIVDAMGGDNAPLEIVKGCVLAVEEYGIEVVLVGNENQITNILKENNLSDKNIEILNYLI